MGNTGTRAYSPWRELLAAGESIVFDQANLPAGQAWWVPGRRVVLLQRGLKQVQRRCALAHELGHRHLGHTGQCRYGDSARMGVRVELEADLWAARRLVTVEQLANIVVWTDDRDEAADELWVTRRLLDVRLDHLHPAERGYVRRRLEER